MISYTNIYDIKFTHTHTTSYTHEYNIEYKDTYDIHRHLDRYYIRYTDYRYTQIVTKLYMVTDIQKYMT